MAAGVLARNYVPTPSLILTTSFHIQRMSAASAFGVFRQKMPMTRVITKAMCTIRFFISISLGSSLGQRQTAAGLVSSASA